MCACQPCWHAVSLACIIANGRHYCQDPSKAAVYQSSQGSGLCNLPRKRGSGNTKFMQHVASFSLPLRNWTAGNREMTWPCIALSLIYDRVPAQSPFADTHPSRDYQAIMLIHCSDCINLEGSLLLISHGLSVGPPRPCQTFQTCQRVPHPLARVLGPHPSQSQS